jgi:Porin-like glycoporin RafY
MKHKVTILAAAVLALGSVSAFADFDANLELDNTYGNNNRGLTQSGRVEVNASKKMGANYFVAGKASLIAGRAGTASTDDMWGQIGSSAAAVKLGRFEAADLFPLARDALVENAGETGYRTNFLRGRTSDGFHAALTADAGGGLGFELGLLENKGNSARKGLRPVISYNNGPLSLAAGFESFKTNASAPTLNDGTKGSGFGLTAGYKFGGLKLTGNLGNGKVDNVGKGQSFALTLDSDAGFTVGMVADKGTPQGAGASKSTAFYAAYTMPLFDVKGASVTFAASTAKAGGTNTSANANGLKVRLNYGF